MSGSGSGGRPRLPFPGDFLWGTATAAHQVEGGNTNNNWYAFEKETGNVFEDRGAGDACEWWSGRAEEDIQRMVALHTNAHRLSVEWSRLMPDPESWNGDAVDRYREILSAMRGAGITPMVTLHHFTNPLWLEERGGWLHEEAASAFEGFVRRVVRDLGDLCDVWCTINEPNVYAGLGYFEGEYPPGHGSVLEYFRVLHNLLAGHARAYHAIHEVQPGARVGLAKHMIAWYPRHPRSPIGRAMTRMLDNAFNEITLRALRTGEWKPPLGRTKIIDPLAGSLDWIGLNYYQRYDVAFSWKAVRSLGVTYDARPGLPRGPGRWGEIYPDGLFDLLGRLYRQFNLPLYVTENGLPDSDDSLRPAFLLRHLQRTWKAIQQGWPVRGYYFWSLVDNFEWAKGYDPRFRFGLYHVDFRTQERVLQESGRLYGEIARDGAITPGMVERYAPEVQDELFADGCAAATDDG